VIPARINGMSEKLIVSHYENNYGGAVKRLNLIEDKAFGGGSGWELLTWSARDKKLVNQWASDHCHTLAAGTSILALDMYEHSYHMDYSAKAATYVDRFMTAIRWSNVDRLFGSLEG
jgi:superoxide dismutase, Fe-Mn family